ncbi:hypothetical protein BDZ94DRAFT_82496 [Collybia nuda]|nr:hypothetical protein BDZ94DRAFT_82496 [Collybia nuda]
MCGEVLRDTRGLIRHVYSIHQESKGKCDHCQMPFSRLEQLNQHMWDKCPALLKLQT